MQSSTFKLTLPIVLCGLLSPQTAHSASAMLYIELPRVAHRPYVAVWLEKLSDKSFAGNVAVWYFNSRGHVRGAQWLPDLRQWWRKSGGSSAKAMDGVTGATRAPGVHTIDVANARAISALQPGDYEIVIEAVREHGGHDILRLPLAWPPKAPQDATIQGQREIGRVRMTVGP